MYLRSTIIYYEKWIWTQRDEFKGSTPCHWGGVAAHSAIAQQFSPWAEPIYITDDPHSIEIYCYKSQMYLYSWL